MSPRRRPEWPAYAASPPRSESAGTRSYVCVLTGHGLKDTDAVQAMEGTLTPYPAELDAIREAMALSGQRSQQASMMALRTLPAQRSC